MLRHKLALSTILNGPKNEDEMMHLKDATNDIASQAFAHLAKAQNLFESFKEQEYTKDGNSNSIFYAFHQAVAANVYLSKLKACDFDPLVAAAYTSSASSSLSYQFKLLRSSLTKSI